MKGFAMDSQTPAAIDSVTISEDEIEVEVREENPTLNAVHASQLSNIASDKEKKGGQNFQNN
jgi:hypothetical protein